MAALALFTGLFLCFGCIWFFLFDHLNPLHNPNKKKWNWRKKSAHSTQFPPTNTMNGVHHYYLLPFNFLVWCFFTCLFCAAVNLINIMSDEHLLITVVLVYPIFSCINSSSSLRTTHLLLHSLPRLSSICFLGLSPSSGCYNASISCVWLVEKTILSLSNYRAQITF